MFNELELPKMNDLITKDLLLNESIRFVKHPKIPWLIRKKEFDVVNENANCYNGKHNKTIGSATECNPVAQLKTRSKALRTGV